GLGGVRAGLEGGDGGVGARGGWVGRAAPPGEEACPVRQRLPEALARIPRAADLGEPAPAAPVVAVQVSPFVVEEGVVVLRGDGCPARRRRLPVAEGLPESLELRGGNLSDQCRAREAAARPPAASLP